MFRVRDLELAAEIPEDVHYGRLRRSATPRDRQGVLINGKRLFPRDRFCLLQPLLPRLFLDLADAGEHLMGLSMSLFQGRDLQERNDRFCKVFLRDELFCLDEIIVELLLLGPRFAVSLGGAKRVGFFRCFLLPCGPRLDLFLKFCACGFFRLAPRFALELGAFFFGGTAACGVVFLLLFLVEGFASFETFAVVHRLEFLSAAAKFLFCPTAGFLRLLAEVLFGLALIVEKLLAGLFLRQRCGVIGLFCRSRSLQLLLCFRRQGGRLGR